MEFMKKTLIDLLKVNTLQQPKAKYSNEVIIQMLECLPDNFTANVELTKSANALKGLAFNRGSLVECIIKCAVLGESEQVSQQMSGKSWNNLNPDLDTSKLDIERLPLVNGVKSSNIEIKFSTSFAPATHKSNKARKTIIVSQSGIYMIDSRNIIYTKAGKLNLNNQRFNDLIPLTALMDLLGFRA